MLGICRNSPEEEDNLQCIEDIWNQSTNIDSRTWTWLYFIWGITLSFNRVVPLKVTVQDRWKTLPTGHWDLVKGDHNYFIEVWIRTRIVPVELCLRGKNKRHDCSLCINKEISYSVATHCVDKTKYWTGFCATLFLGSSPPLPWDKKGVFVHILWLCLTALQPLP